MFRNATRNVYNSGLVTSFPGSKSCAWHFGCWTAVVIVLRKPGQDWVDQRQFVLQINSRFRCQSNLMKQKTILVDWLKNKCGVSRRMYATLMNEKWTLYACICWQVVEVAIHFFPYVCDPLFIIWSVKMHLDLCIWDRDRWGWRIFVNVLIRFVLSQFC